MSVSVVRCQVPGVTLKKNVKKHNERKLNIYILGKLVELVGKGCVINGASLSSINTFTKSKI